MAKYKVLVRSYINGRLREPGDVVELEINDPGSNLQALEDAKPEAGGRRSSRAQPGAGADETKPEAGADNDNA